MTKLEQKLIDLGYKKHVSESNRIFKSTDTLFQKKVTDDKGIRYFIDVWYYPPQRIAGRILDEGIEPEAQMSFEDDTKMNVSFLTYDIGLFEVRFSDVWELMNCIHYELWDQ